LKPTYKLKASRAGVLMCWVAWCWYVNCEVSVRCECAEGSVRYRILKVEAVQFECD